MAFLSNNFWWIAVVAAMAVTSLPSFLRSLSKFSIMLMALVWLVDIVAISVAAGILPALAGAGISLLWGLFLMLISLLFSGIRQMANRRYG